MFAPWYESLVSFSLTASLKMPESKMKQSFVLTILNCELSIKRTKYWKHILFCQLQMGFMTASAGMCSATWMAQPSKYLDLLLGSWSFGSQTEATCEWEPNRFTISLNSGLMKVERQAIHSRFSGLSQECIKIIKLIHYLFYLFSLLWQHKMFQLKSFQHFLENAVVHVSDSI